MGDVVPIRRGGMRHISALMPSIDWRELALRRTMVLAMAQRALKSKPNTHGVKEITVSAEEFYRLRACASIVESAE